MLKSRVADGQAARGKLDRLESGDVQLLGRIAEGDRAAFEALYRDYFGRLARFLDRMTRQPQMIEEIINDSMLVVWQKAGQYNHSSKVSTWIFAIAYRTALAAIRRHDEPVDADFDLVPGAAIHEPDIGLSQRRLERDVGHALDKLSMEQRTVVNLTYFHGMGYEEIAETMDCPINTVKTRMFHARLRLKTMLSGYMELTQ